MESRFRCDCPITSAIDVVGDKWSLVIIKQMIIEHMQTFKDFTDSDEAIATNILSSRLKTLEADGLIIKRNHPNNRKTNLYHLTEKGLSLAPIIVELAIWSDKTLREANPIMRDSDQLEFIKKNKEIATEKIMASYRNEVSERKN